MKTTSLGIAKYTGVCVAGIATSCVIAAPALAMAPPAPAPDPGSSQHHKIFDSQDGRQGPAPTASISNALPSSSSIDWTTIAFVVGGGMAVTGLVAFGVTQVHRRQTHPA